METGSRRDRAKQQTCTTGHNRTRYQQPAACLLVPLGPNRVRQCRRRSMGRHNQNTEPATYREYVTKADTSVDHFVDLEHERDKGYPYSAEMVARNALVGIANALRTQTSSTGTIGRRAQSGAVTCFYHESVPVRSVVDTLLAREVAIVPDFAFAVHVPCGPAEWQHDEHTPN